MILSGFPRLPLRAVLFADGVFARLEGKTAQGVLRHSTILDTVAVVDRTHPSATTASVVAGTGVPVVASLEEALRFAPEALVVAMTESDHMEAVDGGDGGMRHAPRPPGDLPAFWWEQIDTAVRNGLHVISCLHLQLRHTEFADKLTDGQRLVDVRRPYDELPKYSGRLRRSRAGLVHVAGSDCVVGKRTVALQLHREARARGIDAGYVGTGQTCLLAGCTEGAIIDRAPVFQAAGLVEHLVQRADPRHDLLIIKGQASVLHPAFGGLATAILQGSQPDAVVFVHDPRRTHRYHWEHLPVADPRSEIRMVEELGGAPVVAVATRGRDNVAALRPLGLPVVDVLDGDGTAALMDALGPVLPPRP
ncbi:hypothetical protein A6A06_30040 [Streptomyces sp. CB02923]|uniref:DUF1611 domain-containing protein n=1 Tax=Streptomyces sp. CB02923 TaxID=1718985 RepID=UPI00093F4B37|nr:DUF1611 domain-containing protein [Streptomyces sp. CB02923]OKH98416.1 hypothetical protein A6A06_30040 [Streptomyces sp. CB02923]